MKIKLITVGKLKENYLKEGVSEYSKRLRRFSSFEMIELMDEKTPDKASHADNQIILNKEADRILPKIADREFVFVLAIEGKEFSSKDFSQRIQTATIKGFSNITFVIGGSLGLSEKVKKRADVLMSFGTLTFPHQLMRLILVEQVYRAFMIQEGSPYHK